MFPLLWMVLTAFKQKADAYNVLGLFLSTKVLPIVAAIIPLYGIFSWTDFFYAVNLTAARAGTRGFRRRSRRS